MPKKSSKVELPADLTRRLKAIAAIEGKFLQQLVVDLLAEAIKPLEKTYLTGNARTRLTTEDQ